MNENFYRQLCIITCDCIKENIEYVFFNLSSRGGWERWFQGTLSAYLHLRAGYLVANEIMPLSLLWNENYEERVDIEVKTVQEGYNYYVELKCMSFNADWEQSSSPNEFVKSVIEDWKKQTYRFATGGLFSLVLVPRYEGEAAAERVVKNLLFYAEQCNLPHYLVDNCMFPYADFMYVCVFQIPDNTKNSKLKSFLKLTI